MLCLSDISELWAQGRIADKPVSVIKNEYVPENATKFLGHPQTKYEKKLWSAVMFFDNGQCKALTPDYVNTAAGMELHQFKWLKSDADIGGIDPRWQWIPDHSHGSPRLVHYTEGGPWFKETQDCPYAAAWKQEYLNLTTYG